MIELRNRSFAALHHRNFRLLWGGTLVSNTGDWMDQIALNWLVISTTGDPFHLAALNFCRALPILVFTILGGAVADRIERRRMLMATQSCALALALVLAALVLNGHTPLWAILLVATARGMVVSFNLPARHSLIPQLVPPEDLPNAVALNSMTINITKIVGPMLAGVTIAAFGLGVCFVLNALSFTYVIWSLHRMQFPDRPKRETPSLPLGRSIAEGLAYTWNDRTLLLLVIAALVPTFFGQPYMALLTIFAHSVYETGPEGLGLLSACASVGSVCGAFMLASMPGWLSSTRAMLIFLMLLGTFLVLFALSPAMAIAVPFLFMVGAMNIACNASNNTLIQLRAPDHMRGRVMSIMLTNRGLAQLGVAAWAALSGLIGIQAAVALSGMSIVVLGLCFFWLTHLGRTGNERQRRDGGRPDHRHDMRCDVMTRKQD